MQYSQRHKIRRAIAVPKVAKGDRQFIDIVTLSLVGLTFAVAEITQYAGTDVLRQMFAP
ncbi:MAG: hypothetical protein WB697_12105 [Stellaceae bacterium]